MALFRKTWFNSHWPVWAARFLWFLSRLVRTKIIGFDRSKQFRVSLFAHWHGDELVHLPCFSNRGISLLVSHSKDGEIMATAARALGYRVTRGSSSRGAVGGLLALLKEVRAGHNTALAVDGPRGPRGVCKPGIVRLAQKTGAPLFPMGVAASRKFIFKKTWNKVYLPLPFSRQVIYLTEPLYFSEKVNPEEMDALCRHVEKQLHRAQQEAQRVLESWH
jgi:lysophospholipid acyltransferase (LPLAT)-like uncharacterized protein